MFSALVWLTAAGIWRDIGRIKTLWNIVRHTITRIVGHYCMILNKSLRSSWIPGETYSSTIWKWAKQKAQLCESQCLQYLGGEFTHHVDFGHHVYARHIYTHANCNRGPCNANAMVSFTMTVNSKNGCNMSPRWANLHSKHGHAATCLPHFWKRTSKVWSKTNIISL